MPFCLSAFAVLVSLSVFGLNLDPISHPVILYAGLTFGFLAFFLCFRHLPEQSPTRKIILEFLSPLFLMSLLILTLSNLDFLTSRLDLHLIQALNPTLTFISIFSGFIVFYANRDRVEKEIKEEKDNEEQAEQKRAEEFPKRFPRMNRMPLINYISKLFYKEGLIYSLILILILTIFVSLKFPYMSLSFTGDHDMKYSSYVEPAKHMLEHGLLWNQIKYQADPITLPDGKFDTFGQYPIMEWGIVAINTIPSFSLEFNARLYMTIFGVILLLLIYTALKEFLPKRQAILVLFILSTNMIIQFFTYVTVLDPINLIFFFSSLIFLINGLKNECTKKLLISGVLVGIGINIKYHIIIFALPIFLLFLIFYKKMKEETRISYALIYFQISCFRRSFSE